MQIIFTILTKSNNIVTEVLNMFRNENGFSLIELMVVVAIIGILSAVAVPQFQKFQKKAKQAEAKMGLAAVYTAQKVFHIEHDTYYNNLWATGYQPHGVMNYAAYILFESGIAEPPGYSGDLAKNQYISTLQICGTTFAAGISQECKRDPATLPNASDIPSLSSYLATRTTFLAGASTKSDNFLDVWSLDHRKQLTNVINGAL